jgi:WD40 repeat protein
LKRHENGLVEYQSTETIESPTKTPIWRLSWNATGTVLAVSGEDGAISLWRKNFSGAWINVQTIPNDNKMTYLYNLK